MDLSPYVENLRRELGVAAGAGGEEAQALAERLTAALEPAVRLGLLDALSAAADEITRELAPGSVDVRLRSGEPEFVVTLPPAEERADTVDDGPPPLADADEAATARINVRLPEPLKARIEQAAGRERLSVNTWVVRAAAAALGDSAGGRRGKRSGGPGESYTGWVR
jgi:hypothetical protein